MMAKMTEAHSTLNIVQAPTKERGILVVDTEKRIVFADELTSKLLGQSAEELVGKSCSEFSSYLPCANGVCTLDTPCHFLRNGASGEVLIRSNELCTFESRIAADVGGQKLGTIHIVTLPIPNTAISSRNRLAKDFHGIVGKHPSMERLFELTALVASTDVTVHIYGPSGTGKELVAEAIHRLSQRTEKRLVKLNCSTIPATLLESTLFGHAKGSFTGASKDSEGYVEYAEGGTLFLDEIGDVSHEVQIKLLRLLESREFSRVGETRPRFADIRIVTATNQDLKKLVDTGRIREDFFFRINVFPLHLPALCERASDIPALSTHFVEKFNKRLKKNILGISPDAMQILQSYSWPGNVRELQHAIEHAFVKAANGYLLPEHFPFLKTSNPPNENSSTLLTNSAPSPALALTKENIVKALSECNGNASKAAKQFDVSRVTLWKYMKRFNIERLS